MFDYDFLTNIDKMFNWDKNSYKFNRNEKDMHPYSLIDKEDRVIIIHNVLGLNKKDLKLSINQADGGYKIHIEGETKDEVSGTKYSINSDFAVDPTALQLDSIAAAMENGLLYITIFKKEVAEALDFTNIEIL